MTDFQEHREDILSKECQRLTAAVEQVDLQRDDVQVVLDEQTVLLQTNGQRLRETQEELARCHSQYDALVATHQETLVVLEQKTQSFSRLRQVREVFIVHVGGTRGVTSSTNNTMNRQARITLTVECIRTCIVFCLFDVEIQGRV